MHIEQLYQQQISSWQLAQENYQQLENSLRKSIDLGSYHVDILCNPLRKNSTMAKLDQANRTCFLCQENRPQEQLSIPYGSYEILLNPYPIFAPHYTIVSLSHEPQRITGRVGTMMTLAKNMGSACGQKTSACGQKTNNLTVFFNGSACGASCPDHLHFQALEAKNLPLFHDFENAEKIFIHRGHNYTVSTAKNIGRLIYRIVCSAPDVAQHAVERLLTEMSIPCSMCNILMVAKDTTNVEIYVIPRRNFRPKQFYYKDENSLIISPASIEMAGVFVTPDLKTFERITAEDIQDIFSQTAYSDSEIKIY